MKLIIDHLSKSFDSKEVLSEASFTFENGNIYALLGRNGAGKTTMFSLINEELKKDGGRILLEKDGRLEPITFNDTFFMVAEPQLPKFLTGREFVKFFLEANYDKVENPKSIDDYLKLVFFDEDDADRLIEGYSTGMKNKLQMIMFLILESPIILLDEPLTNLDIIVQKQIKDIIRAMDDNHIIILSTHILSLAKDLCEKIVLLHDKKLQAVDQNIFSNPNYEEKIIDLLSDKEKEDEHE